MTGKMTFKKENERLTCYGDIVCIFSVEGLGEEDFKVCYGKKYISSSAELQEEKEYDYFLKRELDVADYVAKKYAEAKVENPELDFESFISVCDVIMVETSDIHITKKYAEAIMENPELGLELFNSACDKDELLATVEKSTNPFSRSFSLYKTQKKGLEGEEKQVAYYIREYDDSYPIFVDETFAKAVIEDVSVGEDLVASYWNWRYR